jgi:hypothetical protein
MTKKLKLTPKVSYILGLYSCNKGSAIGIVTKSNEIAARFVKSAIDDFGIAPNKILVEEAEDEQKLYFYNSKLKKLFDRALDTKERLFKYKNDYSANYFAALFDVNGGKDPKGLFIKNLDEKDTSILDDLGFHTTVRGGKTYVLNSGLFLDFIKEFSIR